MDYIGEPGRATHRAGHVIDLSFSNIPFAKTTVCAELSCGSDYETLFMRIPGRGCRLLQQSHYRIPENRLSQFAGMGEMELHHVPSPSRGRTYPPSSGTVHCAEAQTRALNHAIKTIGKPDRETGRSASWWNEDCATAYRQHLRSC